MKINNITKSFDYQKRNEKKFREEILNQLLIISKYNYLYFKEDDFENKNLQILTAVSENNYQEVLNLIKKNYLILSEFENKAINGVFFKSNYGLKGLIFFVNKSIMKLDKEILNKEIYTFVLSELNESKKKYNLSFLNDPDLFPNSLFFSIFMDYIAFYLNMPNEDFHMLMLENTLSVYINHFNNFKSISIKLDDFIHDEIYNHTKVFSYLYFWIIKIISSVLPVKNEGYSFHDVGTQMVILPAMLLKLGVKDLMNVNVKKIMTSDYISLSSGQLEWIKKYEDISINKTFSFKKLNLLDLNAEYPESDITLVIDVLEHLPDDKSAVNAVLKLWECTKEILIIHVPIEEEENKWPDHNILFDAEKIRKWGTFFENGEFLSDLFEEDQYTKLTDLGFLIVKRK